MFLIFLGKISLKSEFRPRWTSRSLNSYGGKTANIWLTYIIVNLFTKVNSKYLRHAKIFYYFSKF